MQQGETHAIALVTSRSLFRHGGTAYDHILELRLPAVAGRFAAILGPSRCTC